MVTADPVAGFKSKIAPELAPLARPIADCQPHPDNARKHSLPKIARSLNDHGQRSPIVVQASTGYIVKGNGTWTAAAQILGWTEIAQVWQELDDQQALAYLLADNKASDESSYDTPKLVKALNKLVEGPGLMDSLWSNEELEDMVESEAGPTILEGAVGAEFADAAHFADRTSKGAASGEKHKEVPLVMTLADHASFVEWLGILRKRFGTSGTVATIFEAIRRQATAEDEAVKVGRDINEEQRYEVRRELVVSLRDIAMTDPRMEASRPAILSMLEHAEPYKPVAPKAQLPGQTEAFAEERVSPLREEDPDDALAAYRTAQLASVDADIDNAEV